MIPAAIIVKLSSAQRAYLLRHIDIAVPFTDRTERATVIALLNLGLIRDSQSNKVTFPTATIATDSGREAIAYLLAEYAEALIRAGCLEVDEKTAEEIRPIELLGRLKAQWKTQTDSFSQTNPAKSPNLKNSMKPSSSDDDIGR